MNPEDLEKLIADLQRTAPLVSNRHKPSRFDIEKAKHVLPLRTLLRALGDEEFFSQKKIHSPFHPSERPKFYCYKRKGRWVFSCCDKCGKSGDQIAYLMAKFKIGFSEAVRQFLRMAEPIQRQIDDHTSIMD